jgi:hypothetical protein
VGTIVTKDEAQRELLRQWRALPVMKRQTNAQALEFAKSVGSSFEFETLGNRQRVIESWLYRDLLNRDLALRVVDERLAGTKK